MADRKVRYVLEVDYEGGEVTARAADDLRDVEGAAKEAGEGLEQASGGFSKFQASIVTMQSALMIAEQAFAGIQQAAQFAYETLSEGAALADARGDFEDLAAGIGTTADALENELSAAAAGLKTDAELIGEAGELMALGLGLSKDEIVTLTGLAAELDWNFKTLTDTLNTGSTRGLKELGLSIDEVKGKMADLEAQGLSTDEAFRFAIIEAAEEKVGRVGKRSEESAGQLEILENVVANVQDEFARGAAEGFAESLGVIAGSAPAAGAALESAARGAASFGAELLGLASMNIFGGSLDYFIERGRELQEVEQQQAESVNFVRQARADLAEMNAIYAASQDEVAESTAGVMYQGEVAMLAAQEYAEAQEWLARATVWVGDAQEQAAAADYARAQSLAEVTAAQMGAAAWLAGIEKVQAYGGDVFGQIAAAGPAAWDLGAAIYNAADAADATAPAMAQIGVQAGQFTQTTADLIMQQTQQQIVIDHLANAAANGEISWATYYSTVQKALGMLDDVGTTPQTPPSYAPVEGIDPESAEFMNTVEQWRQDVKQPVSLSVETKAAMDAVGAATTAVGELDAMEPKIMLEMDILPVLNGATEAKRLIDEIPVNKLITIDFTATGLEFLQELREAGVLP